MGIYIRPKNRIHRGFFYLDDEMVTNSLSAFEAGKVDEVVAKLNSAREGGIGGALGASAAKIEGGKKTRSNLEEEMVRTRTRFSIFDLWYEHLKKESALGAFNGWGPAALEDVSVGDTLELDGTLSTAPLETVMRLYLWFAARAKEQGNPWSQKGDELKETKAAERIFRLLLRPNDDYVDQAVVIMTPRGEPGPKVALPVNTDWLIGGLGDLGGDYTVIAQVDRIVPEGEELPAIRLTRDVPPTELEIDTLKEAVAGLITSARDIGVDASEDAATIVGPALWLVPLAIYR